MSLRFRNIYPYSVRGRRGRDRMVVRFTTTKGISTLKL